MVADGMLTRQRYREVPPRVEYELTERAYALMPVIGEVAKWGYDWVWSAPRASERVDIGAIFRVAPGLLQPPANLNASVSLVVEDGESESLVLVAEGGKVKVREDRPERTDATVSGNKDAWIAAFSPDGDLGKLRIEGDKRLATQLLEGLALGTEQLARATRAA
jgi:putative sterol carrier protein